MIKLTSIVTYLKTGVTAGETPTDTLSRLGVNISELSVKYNPKTTKFQDVTEDSGTTEVTGYEPSSECTQYVTPTDPCYTFINSLRRKRAILDDAKSYVINVDAYEAGTTAGTFVAEKQAVSIQVNSYGGAQPDPASIGFTLNYLGAPIPGVFNTATKTFTANT